MKIETKYEEGDTLFYAMDDEDIGPTVTKFIVSEINASRCGGNVIVNYVSEYGKTYNENSCFRTAEEAFNYFN